MVVVVVTLPDSVFKQNKTHSAASLWRDNVVIVICVAGDWRLESGDSAGETLSGRSLESGHAAQVTTTAGGGDTAALQAVSWSAALQDVCCMLQSCCHRLLTAN